MNSGIPAQSGLSGTPQKKQLPVFPDISGLAFWAGFCGILTIVGGLGNIGIGFLPAFAIGGNNLVSIIGGAVFGLVFILGGSTLLEGSRQLRSYLKNRQYTMLDKTFKRITLYFRIIGFLFIISVFFILIVCIVILFAIAAQSI